VSQVGVCVYREAERYTGLSLVVLVRPDSDEDVSRFLKAPQHDILLRCTCFQLAVHAGPSHQ